MTTKSQPTSGTRVYLLNTLISPHVALLVPQLKGLSNVGGGPRKKIDVSNNDSGAYDEYQGGRAAPPETSGELVLDLTSTGHQTLKSLFEAGAAGTIGLIPFVVCESDDSTAPLVQGGILVGAQTASPKHWKGSGFYGNCYVADLSAKGSDNDVWRADFKLQVTGKTFWFAKGDLATKTY